MAHTRMGSRCMLALLLLTLALAPSCRGPAQGEHRVLDNEITEPLTARQAYPIAEAYAREWDKGAYLEHVIMVLPGAEIERGPAEITYTFIADHGIGPLRWWDSVFVSVDPSTGEILETSTYRWQTHSQRGSRLDIHSGSLDSSDALRIAEDLGGRDYRQRHPDARVRIVGQCGSSDRLLWGVVYFMPPGSGISDLNYGIDAATGEVRGDAFVPPSLEAP